MKKSAVAYLLKNKVFIQGKAFTTVGLRRMHGEVSIDNITDCVAIGWNILDKLNKAGSVIPHPTQEEYKAAVHNQAPMVEATGMKTWSALGKKTKRVDLDLKNDHIVMTPLKYGTHDCKHAYDDLTDKTLTSPLDPETLGRTLIQAFELCE